MGCPLPGPSRPPQQPIITPCHVLHSSRATSWPEVLRFLAKSTDLSSGPHPLPRSLAPFLPLPSHLPCQTPPGPSPEAVP